jgi:hypothetical protein
MFPFSVSLLSLFYIFWAKQRPRETEAKSKKGE